MLAFPPLTPQWQFHLSREEGTSETMEILLQVPQRPRTRPGLEASGCQGLALRSLRQGTDIEEERCCRKVQVLNDRPVPPLLGPPSQDGGPGDSQQ